MYKDNFYNNGDNQNISYKFSKLKSCLIIFLVKDFQQRQKVLLKFLPSLII